MTDKLQGTAARDLALEAIDEAFKTHVMGIFSVMAMSGGKSASGKFCTALSIAAAARCDAIDVAINLHHIGSLGPT